MIHTLRFKQFAAIGFYILILAGSSVPGQSIPTVFKLTPDKLIHVLEYFILGWLLIRWLSRQFPHPLIAYGVLLIGTGCAALDECWQSFIPNRFSDIWDAAIDVVGVALGIFVFTFFAGKIKK